MKKHDRCNVTRVNCQKRMFCVLLSQQVSPCGCGWTEVVLDFLAFPFVFIFYFGFLGKRNGAWIIKVLQVHMTCSACWMTHFNCISYKISQCHLLCQSVCQIVIWDKQHLKPNGEVKAICADLLGHHHCLFGTHGWDFFLTLFWILLLQLPEDMHETLSKLANSCIMTRHKILWTFCESSVGHGPHILGEGLEMRVWVSSTGSHADSMWRDWCCTSRGCLRQDLRPGWTWIHMWELAHIPHKNNLHSSANLPTVPKPTPWPLSSWLLSVLCPP